MKTACTPEKENNYLLWIIHIIKNDSFIYKSQEHTNVQIKVNIPFLYFVASNRQCLVLAAFYSKSPTTLCFTFLGHFAVSTPTLFLNFADIFLISPTSDQSDFLLKCAVRTVYIFQLFEPVSFAGWI
jgi:hypothetical protein